MAAESPVRFLVSLAALGAVAALFLCRSLDDNRLTSWSWVFARVEPLRLYALVAAAMALAHLATRPPLGGRGRAAALFVVACAVVACFFGAPENVVDASRYFTQAKYVALHGPGSFLREWGDAVPAWTDLPLVPFLHGLVFALLGESRIHVQIVGALCFAGSVVLTLRLGETLWDEEAGLTAGALLLAVPYLPTQAANMLVDVPTMFFVALALLATVHAVQRGGPRRILLAAAAVAAALLTKYSAWLLLTVVPVVGIAHRGSASGALRRSLAVALLALALLGVAVAAWHDTFARQLALLLEYQAPGLRRWGESFASTFLFQVHPFLSLAALFSLGVALRRRDARYLVVAWPALLLAALGGRRVRYLLPAFPMLALMAARGLSSLADRGLRRHVVTCAVGSSLVVALYGYLPFLRSTSAMNLVRAGEYLDAIPEPEAEVFALASEEAEVNPAVEVPILDLSTRKRLLHSSRAPSPAARARATSSPLRFTWEWTNPEYYLARPSAEDAAVVVITDRPGLPLPAPLQARLEGHRLAAAFRAHEGVFRNGTLVDVYRAEPRGGRAAVASELPSRREEGM